MTLLSKKTNIFRCKLQPKDTLQVTAARPVSHCLQHIKLKLYESSTLSDLSLGETIAAEII